MNQNLLLAILLLLVAWPSVGAEPVPVDPYRTCFPMIVGTINQGCADWYVYYPSRIDEPGDYSLSISVSTTVSASATLTIAAGASQTIGCTLGTFTSQGNAASATARIPLQVTGETCHISLRLLLNAGSSFITAVQIGGETQQRHSFTEIAADYVWLVWLLYLGLTRLIRGPYAVYLRVLADLVALGLLALPIPAAQFATLATAMYLLLIIDLFILLERPHGAL